MRRCYDTDFGTLYAFYHCQKEAWRCEAPLNANADLEILAGQQSWEIEVVPGALAVVAGKGIALTLPVETAASVPPLAGPQEPRVLGAAPHAPADVMPAIDPATAPHT